MVEIFVDQAARDEQYSRGGLVQNVQFGKDRRSLVLRQAAMEDNAVIDLISRSFPLPAPGVDILAQSPHFILFATRYHLL